MRLYLKYKFKEFIYIYMDLIQNYRYVHIKDIKLPYFRE